MKTEKMKRILIITVVILVIVTIGGFTLGIGHSSLPAVNEGQQASDVVELDKSKTEEVIKEEVKQEIEQEVKQENSAADKKEISPASEKVLSNVTKKDKRMTELTDKYNDKVFGSVAYYLEVAQKYSLPICFIGIAIGAFNFLIIGNKKLDKKEQGFGWIVGFTIGLVVFNVIPLLFALFVAAR